MSNSTPFQTTDAFTDLSSDSKISVIPDLVKHLQQAATDLTSLSTIYDKHPEMQYEIWNSIHFLNLLSHRIIQNENRSFRY